ncbi:hypothetical protein L596_005739 [Steinernema carpocapsae]|uniref:Uncharacterized protein n=1 Tax=Steinernema carpocapsae TaxID=34508 RepID=A0A4U8UZZ6_STECR|nr:hypothetical protein L596_005739 [Steinernema carpocapsae]
MDVVPFNFCDSVANLMKPVADTKAFGENSFWKAVFDEHRTKRVAAEVVVIQDKKAPNRWKYEMVCLSKNEDFKKLFPDGRLSFEDFLAILCCKLKVPNTPPKFLVVSYLCVNVRLPENVIPKQPISASHLAEFLRAICVRLSHASVVLGRRSSVIVNSLLNASVAKLDIDHCGGRGYVDLFNNQLKLGHLQEIVLGGNWPFSTKRYLQRFLLKKPPITRIQLEDCPSISFSPALVRQLIELYADRENFSVVTYLDRGDPIFETQTFKVTGHEFVDGNLWQVLTNSENKDCHVRCLPKTINGQFVVYLSFAFLNPESIA